MAEVENHFTVFVRLPFNRGEFVDPPPVLAQIVLGNRTLLMLSQVSWNAAKEKGLWEIISRQSRSNELNCRPRKYSPSKPN
jgi:Atg29 N-terminal domain